jgi:hypothetical protein
MLVHPGLIAAVEPALCADRVLGTKCPRRQLGADPASARPGPGDRIQVEAITTTIGVLDDIA